MSSLIFNAREARKRQDRAKCRDSHKAPNLILPALQSNESTNPTIREE